MTLKLFNPFPDRDVTGSRSDALLLRSSRLARFFGLAVVATVILPNSFVVSRAYAQATTADVVGTVVDASGSVVPGATVDLTNLDTHEKRTVVTGNSGEYAFPLLKPDHYSIAISHPGFNTSTIASFSLAAGDRARENSTLQVGSQDQTVQVEGQAPALQSESSVLAATITNAATQDLPLNGRNYINLVQVVPGATEGLNNGLASGNRPDDRRQTSSVSINGQADVINNQLIDGMDNNERVIGSIGVRPSVESIQEVNVQTNTFTAEVGRSAGAVINVITKSGTNAFHGSAYEFFRNTVLDANPYKFGATIPKPKWNQNQFGGSLGGPIQRDKTFFFGDYEGFRLVKGQNPTQTTVPTAFERANPGNFTDNPAINRVVAPAAFDKVGLQYFNLFPQPTSTALTNNYTVAPSYSQNATTADGRVDHHFNNGDIFFVRYTYNAVSTNIGTLFPTVSAAGLSVSPGGNLGSYPGPAFSNAHQVQLDYIHTFTPNTLLELKAGYTLLHTAQDPPGFGQAVNTAFGQPNININSRTNELAPITISQGGTTLGFHPPIIYLENTWQYLGTLNWNHGNHNLKFGAGVIRRQDTSTQTDSAAGTWTIATFADLLTGTFTSVSRNAILITPHNRSYEPHAFIQDDWHAASRLTLNLGVRWDYYQPYTEINNYLSNFDIDVGTIVVAGTPGVDKYGNVRPDYTNIAPRVGFAYMVLPKTVVRGGFGMSYAPENLTSGSALVNQPFTGSYGPCATVPGVGTSTGCSTAYSHFANGLPLPTPRSATNPSGSVSAALDPHFKSTYLEQFNLAAEREFGATVVSLTYVGELGRRMAYYLPDANTYPANTGVAGGSGLRTYAATAPNVTTVPLFTSRGQGSYNGVQFVAKRRLTKGLDLSFNYTYAHGLDDSEAISNDGGDGFGSVPSRVSTLEYGNSNLDVRHRFTGTFNYALPFGNSQRGIKGILAKGWQANGLVSWNTGMPFSETNLNNVGGTRPGTTNSDRPNQIASVKVSNRSVREWFNTAAFQAQAPGTIGNEHRNQIYGPGLQRVDLSLFKTFDLTERFKFEFRTEAFNVLNTAQFQFPTAQLGNTANGRISSTENAYSPRVVQFAGKVYF
jgi:Carboxypeptidase regulatory-like domain/TonB dependent receptor